MPAALRAEQRGQPQNPARRLQKSVRKCGFSNDPARVLTRRDRNSLRRCEKIAIWHGFSVAREKNFDRKNIDIIDVAYTLNHVQLCSRRRQSFVTSISRAVTHIIEKSSLLFTPSFDVRQRLAPLFIESRNFAHQGERAS